jgi:pyruvate kinase
MPWALQTAHAIANFSALAVLADGVVLARGWLGLHVSPEKMAILQKRLIHCCNLLGKLCIVARIADTMQMSPRPTRAEATDIANSVIDGADGFLLGAQTTRGAYPVECVATVLGICREAERVFDFDGHYERTTSMLREVRPIDP